MKYHEIYLYFPFSLCYTSIVESINTVNYCRQAEIKGLNYMRTKSSAPTMKDVAQEAGVALGTVSKVFNGIPVGESYRIRVQEAAERLGYQVNNYARGLKTNKTYTAAVIIPSTTHPFFGLLTEELSRALTLRGYRTLLAITSFDMASEQQCIEMVRQNKVDGIIALTYNPDLKIDDSLPFVSIDRFYSASIPCVSSDNYGGGQLAAEKLHTLGCRNLLFLRSGSSVPGEPDKRGAGFEAYCQLHRLSSQSLRIDDTEGIRPILDFIDSQIRDERFPFDGIFCSTDHLAADVLNHLALRGISCPRDVQLIGFDGLNDFFTKKPVCSTIVQPVSELAATAVDILLSQDRSRLPALTCLPVRYQPGGTTREQDH